MEQENLDVVLAHHAAVRRGDFADASGFHSDDFVLVVDPSVAPDSGTFRGREASSWYRRWFRTFGDDYDLEITETIDEGEAIVVVYRHHAAGRASGARVEMTSASVFWVADAKIRRAELYRDRAQALEAASAG